jgi:hypothetical protein
MSKMFEQTGIGKKTPPRSKTVKYDTNATGVIAAMNENPHVKR